MQLDRRTILMGAPLALILPAIARAEASPPLHVRGNRLFIKARLNGHSVEALLDSGAEMSLVDRAFAVQAGLGGGKDVTARGSGAGEEAAQLVEGVTIEATGVTLANRTVAILDLSDIARRLIGGPLPLIVGRDLFDATRLEIDIAGGCIAALPRTGTPKGVRLPLTADHGIESIPVTIEGKPALATFDLGNGTKPMVSSAFAKRTGMIGDGRAIGSEPGGGLGGETTRQTLQIREIVVAGRSFPSVDVAIEDKPNSADANIGVSILRHFDIVTDFAERAVWLSPR